MATGAPGTNGVWQYGEDDSETTFSALLNKVASTTNTQIGLDRTRLTALEAAGRVVQVVSSSVTTAFSTTSETFVNTNLYATITPKSSSNKILVLVSASGAPTAGGNGMVTSVHRGGVAGTNLGNGDSGLHYWYAASATVTNGHVSVYDSPGTTSATSYYYTARSWNAGVGSTPIRGTSKAVITLIEVAG